MNTIIVPLLLGIVLLALPPFSASAVDPANGIPSGTLDPAAAYKEVDLKELVSKAATGASGQRIIFAPTAIRFKAALGALPVAQKADYLYTALGMMKVGNPPKVSQRIGIDFGGERLLPAYIEDGAATRLGKETRIGQSLTFYAYHVYNYSKGPALLVTSFSE